MVQVDLVVPRPWFQVDVSGRQSRPGASAAAAVGPCVPITAPSLRPLGSRRQGHRRRDEVQVRFQRGHHFISASRCIPSRSIPSFCMTRTTELENVADVAHRAAFGAMPQTTTALAGSVAERSWFCPSPARRSTRRRYRQLSPPRSERRSIALWNRRPSRHPIAKNQRQDGLDQRAAHRVVVVGCDRRRIGVG